MLLLPIILQAQNVTIRAVNQPAAIVFRFIVEQTGMNFVYSSELLKDMYNPQNEMFQVYKTKRIIL